MLRALLRLVLVVAILGAGGAGVVLGLDGISRVRIDQAALQSVMAGTERARAIAVGSPEATSPEDVLEHLSGRATGERQTGYVVRPDGTPAGTGPVAGGLPGVTDGLTANLLVAGQPILAEVWTASGPGWAATLPVWSEGELRGTYVLVESYGPLLERQQATTMNRLRLLAGACGAVVLLGFASAGALAGARQVAPWVGPWARDRWRRVAGSEAARPLGAVVIEGFGSRLAFGLLSFALPLYAYSLGMSLAHIGLLLSTNMVVAILLKPAMGALIDRIGVRRAYVLSLVLRTGVLVVLVVASGPAWLFGARALHGVSIALRDPAASTILAALGGKKAVAQRFAWYQTLKSVAGSAGSFGAGVLLTLAVGNYAVVFAVAAVLSGAPLLVVLRGLRGPAVESLRIPRPPRGTPMPAELRRVLLPYAGLGALMTGTAYLMANLLPVLAVEYMGLAPAAAASLYLVKSVVSLTGPLWGWVSDHVSVRLVLGVRAFGNAFSSIIWLLVPTYAGLLAGRVADDLGKAAFAPAWGAVMAHVSDLDPARRSQTLAWMSAAEDTGEMAGPVVAGVIWSVLGLPALLIIRAVVAIGTEGYAWWLGRRVRLDAGRAEADSPPPGGGAMGETVPNVAARA